jgi:multiple sugar transport system permease protein
MSAVVELGHTPQTRTVFVPGRQRMSARKRLRRAVRTFFILVVGLILAGPLIYLAGGSLMSDSQLTSFPPPFFPNSIHLSNFAAGWRYIEARTLLNSVIFTAGVVGVQWALCISGGFALAKMRFRGRMGITLALGVSLFLPATVTLVPTFIVVDKFHLLNTYPGLILPIAAQTAFGTLLFRQFIVNLPSELVDAARVDGAKWRQILRRVIVPLAMPATGAYAAISLLTAWNLYLWPLVAATKPQVEVLTEVIAVFGSASAGGQTVPETVAFACTMITTLPMLLVFLVAQRTFIRAISGSGVE